MAHGFWRGLAAQETLGLQHIYAFPELLSGLMKGFTKYSRPYLEDLMGEYYSTAATLGQAVPGEGISGKSQEGMRDLLARYQANILGQAVNVVSGQLGGPRGVQQDYMGAQQMGRYERMAPLQGAMSLGGTLGGAAIGAYGQAQQGQGCLLATACYGKKSDEVDFFRLFRDYILPQDVIRGYYIFSDLVLPLMKFKVIKNLTKRMIVNPLMRAGRMMIFQQSTRVKTIFDYALTSGWLLFWKILGTRKSYRRKTGETV